MYSATFADTKLSRAFPHVIKAQGRKPWRTEHKETEEKKGAFLKEHFSQDEMQRFE